MTYPKITTEKGSQSSQDSGPVLPPGLPGLDEFYFFLGIVELDVGVHIEGDGYRCGPSGTGESWH